MQKLSASLVVCLVLFAIAGNASAQTKEPPERFIILENGLYGYVDRTGKAVIPPQYSRADVFSDGLALVSDKDFFGYIDKTGKAVLDLKGIRFPGSPRRFSEGLASFSMQNGRGGFNSGYIDKTGKIVIEPQFDEANDFSDGMARVKQYGKYTFIDKTGKIITDPVFDDAGDFSGGLARITIGMRWGYIDKQGRYVWRSK
jgi:hypothetical protein